jgi:hypothetical protein
VEVYPIAGPADKIDPALAQPRRWNLDQRLEQTWWRNPNARGIAEADPRTVARGRRARRALRSPCPHSRRRVGREKRIDQARHQIPRVVARLYELAPRWTDAERLTEVARELEAAWNGGAWLMEDPEWNARPYAQRGPLYLPRRASAEASRFLRAYAAARRLVHFVENTLDREKRARLGSLVALVAARSAPVENRSTRSPDERRYIDLAANGAAFREQAERGGWSASHFTSRPAPPNVT